MKIVTMDKCFFPLFLLGGYTIVVVILFLDGSATIRFLERCVIGKSHHGGVCDNPPTGSPEEAPIESESESAVPQEPAQPISSTNNSMTRDFFQGYVDGIVQDYDDLLQDVILGQTESWNFLSQFEGVDESATMESCPPTASKKRSTVAPTLSQETLAVFEWDDERDIGSYLDRLDGGCARNALEDPLFQRDCWAFMHDLVYQPRCTTRFDSRVTCQRGQHPPGEKVAVEDLLEDHFDEKTLNVVIVGSGPTGLFLANALAVANRLPSKSWHPEIRVVVLEHRVEAMGVKQEYVRNWQTNPELGEMVGAMDGRLGTIFSHLARSDFFALPLNVIETLLLLSSRDLGVKFLYGSIEEFQPALAEHSNLLVFDATGHRLDGLVRGKNCPTPDDVTRTGLEETIERWTPSRDIQKDWYYVTPKHYRMLNQYNFIVDVAQQGNLMYPVTQDGLPYAVWWLHVHEIPYDLESYFQKMETFLGHVNTHAEMCRPCQNSGLSPLRVELCTTFCGTNYFFEAASMYREDITESVERDDSSLWFGTRIATANLSGQEAQKLLQLVNDLGYGQDPLGMPISLLPFQDLAQDPVFQEGSGRLLLESLTAMAEFKEGDRQPIISIFQHRPYIYRNGEIPGARLGLSERPILRIGDSLATGDPNHSTGFVSHVWMIRRLICRMRPEEEC